MGKLAPTDRDMASSVLSGVLSSAEAGLSRVFTGTFNVELQISGTLTAAIQRSFNGGTTWVTVSQSADGTAAAYSASVSMSLFEPEEGVYWRVNVTSFTSGSCTYRISQ